MFVAMSREYHKVGASFGGCPALADPDGGCRRAAGKHRAAMIATS
jgi:hypothetical protein